MIWPSYYDQHREQYSVPAQVKVSHILIKTPAPGSDGKVDEKGVAEAQRRAEDLLKQIKGGASSRIWPRSIPRIPVAENKVESWVGSEGTNRSRIR